MKNKNTQNTNEDIDAVKMISDRLSQVSGYMSTQYAQIKDDLEFASGKQWTTEERNQRETVDGRPTVTIDQTRPYIDRIVNALRVAPIGIRVETDNEDATEIIQDKVRAIEYENVATEAYEQAYENAVAAGIGFIKIGTKYENDDTLDQKITIDRMFTPTAAFIDPFSTKIDGSDANWGGCVDFIDEDIAKETYGDDATGVLGNISAWNTWKIPENSVAELVFYMKRTQSEDRYWLTDGTVIDGKDEIADLDPSYINKSRKIEKSVVEVYHYIGSKLIDKTELPIKYIPIVPVYGDRLYLDDENIYYGGIVHRLRDLNKMVNYLASTEMELASQSPKAPWIIAESQIEGYEEIWENANTTPIPFLPYKPVLEGENILPPPTRVNNSAQTQGFQQQRQMLQNDFGRVTGIYDQMFGNVDSNAQSGKAILLRQSSGELSTAQYLDNLAKSIAHVGKIVVDLMPYIYDTDRKQTLKNSDGDLRSESMNIADIFKQADFKSLDITAHAGPSYESRRREAVATILELGQAAPDKLSMTMDLLVDNLDAPGSKEISKRLKKMLPPGMLDEDVNAPDPQAIEALNVAQSTIAQQDDTLSYYEGVIQQLQSALISNQKDREQKMASDVIKAETDIAKTRMNNETDIQQELIKANNKTETTEMNNQADLMKEIAKIQADSEKRIQDMLQGFAGNVGITEVELIPDVDDFVPRAPGPVAYKNAETDEANALIEAVITNQVEE